MSTRRKICVGLAIILGGLYLFNASWLTGPPERDLTILSHRGVHQTFHRENLTNETCTAERIFTPEHTYIENTIESFDAAIRHGADMIELDIHPTNDGEFVIFHDWTLDCRTDGHGRTRDHNLAYLQSLDLGYGYTADGGQSFPLRGYAAPMPTLSDILSAFPDMPFIINIKSRSKSEARALLGYVPEKDWSRLSLSGHNAALSVISSAKPGITTASRQQAKACLKGYVVAGWTGYVPAACANSFVPVPENYRWLIWGWPHRFEKRLNAVNSRSLLMGPLGGVGSTGIDTLEDIDAVPTDYAGAVWTNKVEIIGPALDQRTYE